MDNLPVETLAFILKLSIWEYFSWHQDPWDYPPVVLHVCRRWREIAINTPGCWATLMFTIDTRSKCAYGQRNLHLRKTEGKASQYIMGNYFKWAKNVPITLSLAYHIARCEASQDCQRNLTPWLVKNIPMLRSFAQILDGSSGTRTGGALGDVWSQLPSNRFTHLTQLHIDLDCGTQSYSDIMFTVPNLLIAIFQGSSKILEILEAPKLNHLEIGRFDPRDSSLLAKYPLLRKLCLLQHHEFEYSIPEMQCEGLRCFIIRRDYNTHNWYYVQLDRDDKLYQFLAKTRVIFPNLSSWLFDVVTGSRLVEAALKLAPEMEFSFITTLTIMVVDYPVYPPYTDAKRRFASFWKRFPCLKQLILGGVWLGGLEHDAFIELIWDARWMLSNPREPVGAFLEKLIQYLGISTAEGLDGMVRLPSLEEIVLQDFEIRSNLLTDLRKFLESRSQSGESRECQITLRRCYLCESELGPARSVEAEDWKLPPPTLRPEY